MAYPIIKTDDCCGCESCVDACPNDVLEIEDNVSVVKYEEACTQCGECQEECPMGAIIDFGEEE